MAYPTTGYLPRIVLHLVEIYSPDYNRVFRYEATIPLDGMSEGVTTDLLDTVTNTIATAALAILDPDSAGGYNVQASYQVTSTADMDATPEAP